jgi:hypothetical protein
LLTEADATHAADIPTLTDIVTDAEIIPVRAQTELRAEQSVPEAVALASGADAVAAQGPDPAPEVEVISRVQAQNMEHAVFLKLKQELNDQIAEVVRERFMPEIGAALGEALQKVTRELDASIGAMVRSSIEETLQQQIGNLRLALQDGAAREETVAKASAIMPTFSEAPPRPAEMELAKSFEPAAIEAHWYPVWEGSGYFRAGLDGANPNNHCILLPPPDAWIQHVVATRNRPRRHRHADRRRAPARSAGRLAP